MLLVQVHPCVATVAKARGTSDGDATTKQTKVGVEGAMRLQAQGHC